MNFERMLAFRFQLGRLTFLSETDFAMLLQPNCTLFSEDNVIETFSILDTFFCELARRATWFVSQTIWQYLDPHRFNPNFCLVRLMVAIES